MGELRKELLMKRTREEIYATPPARQIPLAPYNKVDDVVNSPQMQARGFFVESDHPEAGRLKYPSAPYQFSETPWGLERPAPLLGQHNEDIYCRRLGYSKQDLIKLREGGII
jgi:crotonobetainyl-CoA:carnitine CoA-transferase CaiB-like acyl-CoA transferase